MENAIATNAIKKISKVGNLPVLAKYAVYESATAKGFNMVVYISPALPVPYPPAFASINEMNIAAATPNLMQAD